MNFMRMSRPVFAPDAEGAGAPPVPVESDAGEAAPVERPAYANDDEAINAILGTLEKYDDITDDAKPTEAARAEQDSAQKADAAPETASGEGEGEKPAEPAIPPPSSWSAEAKANWAKLPPDLQTYLSERDKEATRVTNQRFAEAAEQRKAVQAEAQRIAQQQQYYTQVLPSLVQTLQQQATDKWGAVDWNKIAAEAPADWVRLRNEYEADIARVRQAQAEQQRVTADAHAQAERLRQEFIAVERAKLLEAVPDLANGEKVKAIREGVNSYLRDMGYSTDEISGVIDHRALRVAIEAAEAPKLRAEIARLNEQIKNAAKSVVEKKLPAPVPVAPRPAAAAPAGDDDEPTRQRVTADRTKLQKSRHTHEQAAILERYLR